MQEGGSPVGGAKLRQKHVPIARFLRFALVGGCCFLLNLAVLWMCTDKLGLHYQMSLLAAFVVVNLVGLVTNRLWSFKASGSPFRSQVGRYYLVMAVSLGASMAMMHLLVEQLGLDYLVANCVAAAILLMANFGAHSAWTFRSRPLPSIPPS